MGTGLAMRVAGKSRKGSVVALGLVALVLAGCSNDPARIDYRQIASGLGTQLGTTMPFAGARTAARTGQTLAEPAVILAQTDAPVTLVQPVNGASPFYVVGVRDNGPWRTYATGTRQTLVMRQGIVTATRGLGRDLMASDADQTLVLLRARQSGKARRVMQVLDGEDVTRDIVLDCTLSTGATVRTGTGIAGQTMTEDCTAPGLRFRNTYVVDTAGQVIRSEQWLPTQLGPLILQVLRH